MDKRKVRKLDREDFENKTYHELIDYGNRIGIRQRGKNKYTKVELLELIVEKNK